MNPSPLHALPQTPDEPLVLFWFRRDLRLADNTGLFHALQSGHKVLPLFIFDTAILDKLEGPHDRRVQFIQQQLTGLQEQLRRLGSDMLVLHGQAIPLLQRLAAHFRLRAVYTNHDYEPYARQRDEQAASLLHQLGVEFRSFKDQVIFEKNEVVKADNSPYTVFTPYSKRWKLVLGGSAPQAFASESLLHAAWAFRAHDVPTLPDLGFSPVAVQFPAAETSPELLRQYATLRDTPALAATSRLSVHLRFGTVSIRSLVAQALLHSDTWLNELIWREFYMSILWHFPHSASACFKREYEALPWRNNAHEFQAWCEGRTGYPIVDAGIHELLATGFMHNRVRMIVASFLTKHLLIDWRWGEAFFARHLLDFDLSANVGGWQWAASTGCDAVPYFRIFNPALQTQRFDPELRYIRRWLPHFAQPDYPAPIVPHEQARLRAIDTYRRLRNEPPLLAAPANELF